ncbi:transcription termination factor 5, mitochondrial-like [Maniola jurtina]|uniref:transcription termination factor 5, mitochondrial-like n=1 Tax=Maniola jurtina TaxID=191418 RepID=UPI001E688784|nr:transcription termination factor 5, mitochondrial-like [Maniola jurtina]
MIFRILYRRGFRFWRQIAVRSVSSCSDSNVKHLCKYLNVNESKAQYLLLKHPVIKKLDSTRLKNVIEILYELGFHTEVLLKEPSLCSILPVTLKFRFQVLQECGVDNISPSHLLSHLMIMKQKTIGELKNSKIISATVNVENRLASYMTQWPTSLTTLVYGDVNKMTLYTLRLKIIQRYLELILDLSQDEFDRGLQTYPTVKHRPLQAINKTLSILQGQILMTNDKIKSNFYLVHADPENLENIIYNLRTIGGIDIKEVIRMHPKLATKNCSSLLEIKKLLEEYGIGDEAQRRCFQIYTLSPSTIKDRLDKARSTPEFNAFYNHPRFLKMIHYNTKASERLMNLYNNNKKCLSLNILSGSSAHYNVFNRAQGDRLGKGKDLLFCISQSLDNLYSMNDIGKVIKRHPFWQYIPLIQVKYVQEQLRSEFTVSDIFENCTILLYPWNKIRHVLNLLNMKKSSGTEPLFNELLDLKAINKSQKLSLILYILERNHYFSGNGVWSEEKQKNIVDLTKEQETRKSIISTF